MILVFKKQGDYDCDGVSYSTKNINPNELSKHQSEGWFKTFEEMVNAGETPHKGKPKKKSSSTETEAVEDKPKTDDQPESN